MGGYWGKLLKVDLTEGKISNDPLPEDWRKLYLGGTGLSAKILYDEVPAGTDPLGPENVFIFSVGPFQGGCLAAAVFLSVPSRPLRASSENPWGEDIMPKSLRRQGLMASSLKGNRQNLSTSGSMTARLNSRMLPTYGE